MLLAIDVGNTNMVFGLFREEELIGTFRLTTDANRTADEIGLTVCQYFHRFHIDMDSVEDIIIASVVPQMMYTLKHAMLKYFEKKPLIIDEDIFPNLMYEEEERLGADRSVCCDAAIEKYGKPLIVLDFGTATTVDAISDTGWYLGGCILAGLQTTTEALFSKAAQLPQIELVKPPTVLARDIVGQIQGGCIAGYIGTIEHLVQETKREMGYGNSVKVVATGGLAQVIAKNTKQIDCVDDQLILDGLLLLYKKHKQTI